ncbi:hypothetical protein D3C74_258530 [compost metagenome]
MNVQQHVMLHWIQSDQVGLHRPFTLQLKWNERFFFDQLIFSLQPLLLRQMHQIIKLKRNWIERMNYLNRFLLHHFVGRTQNLMTFYKYINGLLHQIHIKLNRNFEHTSHVI